MEQCSELFERVFDSGCGGIVRECECGITHFSDQGCDVNFYDDGELSSLQSNAKLNPTKYIGHDHNIGTMEIGGIEIVHGCTCGKAQKYEDFILTHAQLLAEYLNERAKMLREKAESIVVDSPTSLR